MTNELFVAATALALAATFAWGFRALPGERWQFLATYPVSREADGSWRGVNVTWYGVFGAVAAVAAAMLAAVLMGSIGIPLAASLGLVGALLLITMPAARIVARIVEGRRHTFTVGGASFVGLVCFPFLVAAADRWIAPAFGVRLPVVATLAAMSVAYALGEAIGRLGCISFGCCYGRPLAGAPGWVRRLFARWHFVFHGPTRKVAYAGHLEGEPVIPVQAITASVYAVAALCGTWLYLRGHYAAALLVSMLTTQVWRVLSELLRADFRGDQFPTVYQWLALGGVVFTTVLVLVVRDRAVVPSPDVAAGVASLWDPLALIAFRVIWVATLAWMGRSTVTTARLTFGVVADHA